MAVELCFRIVVGLSRRLKYYSLLFHLPFFCSHPPLTTTPLDGVEAPTGLEWIELQKFFSPLVLSEDIESKPSSWRATVEVNINSPPFSLGGGFFRIRVNARFYLPLDHT